MKHHFEQHEHYIYTRFEGATLELEDLFTWIGEFLEYPSFRSGTNVIWDLLRVSDTNLSFGDMQVFGDFLLAHRDRRGGGRSSLVANNDLVFGLFRTHEMLNQHKFDYEFHVFRELDAARAWILEQVAD